MLPTQTNRRPVSAGHSTLQPQRTPQRTAIWPPPSHSPAQHGSSHTPGLPAATLKNQTVTSRTSSKIFFHANQLLKDPSCCHLRKEHVLGCQVQQFTCGDVQHSFLAQQPNLDFLPLPQSHMRPHTRARAAFRELPDTAPHRPSCSTCRGQILQPSRMKEPLTSSTEHKGLGLLGP